MMGGSLATAGGLAFTGEGNGNFNAYDSRTGKLLWHFNAGAGCNAAPMTFTHGGEQFIAVACGGNFQLSSRSATRSWSSVSPSTGHPEARLAS